MYCFRLIFLQVAYRSWGQFNNPEAIVLCVHGLTGSSLNFAYLADLIVDIHPSWRVVALDLPGRGSSDWFDNHENYNHGEYIHSLLAVYNSIFPSSSSETSVSSSNPKRFYFGTSLGGLLAMFLNTNTTPSSPNLFDAYCFNDIGPIIPHSTLSILNEFNGINPHFDSFEEAVERVKRDNKVQWGPTTDDPFWEFTVRNALRDGGVSLIDPTSYRPEPDVVTEEEEEKARKYGYKTRGRFCFSYDIHGIGKGKQMSSTKASDGSFNILERYKRINKPVLLLQGEISIVCPPEVVDEMKKLSDSKQGPPLTVELYEKTGHIIPLYSYEENIRVVNWLSKI